MKTAIKSRAPVSIFDMLEDKDAMPERSYKSAVIYGPGNFLATAPEKMSRNQVLSYVESKFASLGHDALQATFMGDMRCKRGVSMKAFNNARDVGLWIFNKRAAK